ncbi:hypothetical protein GCM10010232_68000 [Streptomyces amakusaensis]|uniref:Lipoprotein n=1 Tax=Streptomyces amakusaensis TaxID=67271 RepID=A0ABW0ASJ2_9ACTN
MTTASLPARHTTIPGPQRRRRLRRTTGAATALLLAALTGGCDWTENRRVMSEAEFREHLTLTQKAGEDAVRSLGETPSSVIAGREMANASCKDDFGTDPDGTTRDQPTVTWAPQLATPAAYNAAIAALREAWTQQGLTAQDLPAPEPDEPGAGLPGIRTTDDHGIELSLRPSSYSGKPTLLADGGCVRHRGILVDWE